MLFRSIPVLWVVFHRSFGDADQQAKVEWMILIFLQAIGLAYPRWEVRACHGTGSPKEDIDGQRAQAPPGKVGNAVRAWE